MSEKIAKLIGLIIAWAVKIGLVTLAIYIFALAGHYKFKFEYVVLIISLSLINALFPVNVVISNKDD